MVRGSGLCGHAPQYAEIDQFQDQPHDRYDENHNQHHALSWFQRLRQTDHSKNGESEGYQDEQHAEV